MGRNAPRSADAVTVKELQEQIRMIEGFTVSFSRLGALDVPIPPYPYELMAPSRWRVADWKAVRLAPYILIFRSVDVYRGDETIAKNDLRLATLRDSYYLAKYGSLEAAVPDNVLPLDPNKARRRDRSR